MGSAQPEARAGQQATGVSEVTVAAAVADAAAAAATVSAGLATTVLVAPAAPAADPVSTLDACCWCGSIPVHAIIYRSCANPQACM